MGCSVAIFGVRFMPHNMSKAMCPTAATCDASVPAGAGARSEHFAMMYRHLLCHPTNRRHSSDLPSVCDCCLFGNSKSPALVCSVLNPPACGGHAPTPHLAGEATPTWCSTWLRPAAPKIMTTCSAAEQVVPGGGLARSATSCRVV